MNHRTRRSLYALGALISLVLITVLVAPSTEKGTPYSSHSAGPDGMRLARDLAKKLGWAPEARTVEFSDSLRDPAAVQVVIHAPLSAAESHALLQFVRAGGSLLVADPSEALADSLYFTEQDRGELVEATPGPGCTANWRANLSEYGTAAVVGWTHPISSDTVGFGQVSIDGRKDAPNRRGRPAMGFPYGAGRLVVVADANYLVNDMLRRCEIESDVAYVRMLEYLTRGRRGERVAFDEFHHGYGVRGGSFAAIRMYLSGTSSGRMLAQMAVGGLLLLFAFAPRPLDPRDPEMVQRRSPLEHADALARAYASVNATRTATARLLAGLRRRTRRDRHRSRASDEDFLATAASLSPAAGAAAQTVAHALQEPLPDRELPAIANALATIERAFERPSPTR